MKKLMKYAILPRALVLLLALSLALSVFVLPAAAATEKVYTEWTYDQTNQTLTATFPDGDTEVYYRVEDDSRLRYDPDYRYKYYNSVSINGSSYKIYAAEDGGDTLALYGFNEDWIFFTAADKDGWDTYSSAAAPLKDPHRAMAETYRSCSIFIQKSLPCLSIVFG